MSGKRHYCPWCGAQTRLAQRKSYDGYCSSDCQDYVAVNEGKITEEEFLKRHPRASLFE